MSPTGSVQSSGSSFVGFVMKMAQNSTPGVEVLINNHTPQKTYTTFDPVTGVVRVTAPQNVRFDEIRITLEGAARRSSRTSLLPEPDPGPLLVTAS
jgi:hypothetical protein